MNTTLYAQDFTITRTGEDPFYHYLSMIEVVQAIRNVKKSDTAVSCIAVGNEEQLNAAEKRLKKENVTYSTTPRINTKQLPSSSFSFAASSEEALRSLIDYMRDFFVSIPESFHSKKSRTEYTMSFRGYSTTSGLEAATAFVNKIQKE